MRSILKSGLVWQFAGGFLIGAVGLFTLQPHDNVKPRADPSTTAAHVAR